MVERDPDRIGAGVWTVVREEKNGCATYRWKLSRPTCLPVIFKLAIEMAGA